MEDGISRFGQVSNVNFPKSAQTSSVILVSYDVFVNIISSNRILKFVRHRKQFSLMQNCVYANLEHLLFVEQYIYAHRFLHVGKLKKARGCHEYKQSH